MRLHSPGPNSRTIMRLTACCLLLFVGVRVAVCHGANSTRRAVPKSMGVSVAVYLFDINAYREKVLPAYDSYSRADDPERLVALLRECQRVLEGDPALSKRLLWGKTSIEDDIGILAGEIYYSPDGGRTSNQSRGKAGHEVRLGYAHGLLGANIVRVLCVARVEGVDVEQDLGKALLNPYLCERSAWIRDLINFDAAPGGGSLEIPLDESSDALTKDELRRFGDELQKVQPPSEPGLLKEYENLKNLIRLALADPALTLILSERL
jgi:hypothetical protein